MIPVSTVSYRFDLLGPIMQHSELLAPYIAHLVMPPLLVNKLAGAIPTFLYSDAQIFNIAHAKGARFSRIISKVDTKTFACTENGIEEPLTFQDYDMISRDTAHMVVSAKLADIVLKQRENTLASSLMGSAGETTFANQITDGTNAWDGSSGDPFANIADAKVALNKRIGYVGDTLVMSYTQYMKLMKNAKFQTQVRAVLGYSGEFAMIAIKLEQDPQMIADVFGVKKVFVGRATYNSANEGQTASYAEIWPTAYALLCKTYDGANSPLPMQQGLGRMFSYETANELGQLSSGTLDALRALIVEQYPEAQTNSDVLRAREFTGFSLLSTACGQLIKNI